ncbi:DUF2971 domain-containing protein [Baekduia sp.]|jgi:hypothetical protein|uniref:DUF2971 domain-containing protein n=1 Tax=Baekduia sp. TaxID=2600305 RepID=UPI002DFDB451|nr:DUF2971 domain-containing protein [Baekduia sp.]
MMRFDPPPNTHLRKVIYNRDVQRETVREITTNWLETARTMIDRGEDIKEVFPYPAIWGLQDALAEHHLCFKHPSFAEEQEWRIIKLVDVREEMGLKDHLKMKEQMESSFEGLREMGFEPPPPRTWNPYENAEGVEIRFRRGATGLVPFVEVPLRERAGVFTNRLPLWAVVQGPTTHPELALEALTLCLQSRGYGFHTTVRPSAIPLRR